MAPALIEAEDLRIRRTSEPVSFSVSPGELVIVTGYSGDEGEEMLNALAGLRKPAGGRLTLMGGRPDTAGIPARTFFLPPGSSLDPSRSLLRQLAARHATFTGSTSRSLPFLRDWLVSNHLEREAMTKAGRLPGWQRRFAELSVIPAAKPELVVACETFEGMPVRWSNRAAEILAGAAEEGACLLFTRNPQELAERADLILWMEEGE
jgi:ABC-type multidrug transport system ATPase subunit